MVAAICPLFALRFYFDPSSFGGFKDDWEMLWCNDDGPLICDRAYDEVRVWNILLCVISLLLATIVGAMGWLFRRLRSNRTKMERV